MSKQRQYGKNKASLNTRKNYVGSNLQARDEPNDKYLEPLKRHLTCVQAYITNNAANENGSPMSNKNDSMNISQPSETSSSAKYMVDDSKVGSEKEITTQNVSSSKLLEAMVKYKYQLMRQIRERNQKPIDHASQYLADNELGMIKEENFGKENSAPIAKRQCNEIQAASLVCPVLIRNPATESLRAVLNDAHIYRNYSNASNFQTCLAEIGEQLIQNYISAEKINSTFREYPFIFCVHCKFRTESRLVLQSHMDKNHNKWPFYSIDKKTNKYKNIF